MKHWIKLMMLLIFAVILGCGGGGNRQTVTPGTGAIEGYVWVPAANLTRAETGIDPVITPMLTLGSSQTPPLGYVALVGADITVEIQGQTAKTKTDSTGHFKVGGLPSGTAKVTITPPLIGNTGLGKFLAFTTTMKVKDKTTAYIGNSGSISLIGYSADHLDVVINQIDSSRSPTLGLYISVIDPTRNTPIIGLGRQNFAVKIAGSTAAITNVRQVESFSAPISVCLVLDRSGSMWGQPFTDLQSAAKQFIDYLDASDRAEIVSFSYDPTVDCAFTDDKSQLNSAIDQLVSDGATALYDAVGLAIDNTSRETNTRKAVVVITDGGENNSSNFDLGRATSNAKITGIPVYTIGLAGEGFTRSGQRAQAESSRERPTRTTTRTRSPDSAEEDLQRLARETGGEYFYAPGSSDLMGIYTKISQRQQQMYVVTVTDPSPQDSDRTVEVTVSAYGLSGSGVASYHLNRFDYPVEQSLYIPGSYAGRSFYYDGVHLGEDIQLDESTPIKAIGEGKIVQYEAHNGYGELCTVIEHNLGRQVILNLHVGDTKQPTVDYICSIYGHIRKSQNRGGPELPLQVGDTVAKGQVIGYINDDAHNGDGEEHLHMGIRLGPHPGYWVYYGYNTHPPESNVENFAAFSEVIHQLQ